MSTGKNVYDELFNDRITQIRQGGAPPSPAPGNNGGGCGSGVIFLVVMVVLGVFRAGISSRPTYTPPTITLPKFDMPKFDMPKIELPQRLHLPPGGDLDRFLLDPEGPGAPLGPEVDPELRRLIEQLRRETRQGDPLAPLEPIRPPVDPFGPPDPKDWDR